MNREKSAFGLSQRIWGKIFTRIGITAVIIAGVVIVVIYLTEKGCRTIPDIAEKFKTGKITTEFRDYVTEMKGIQRLQVASLKTTDIFTRVDSRSILWDLIPLGDVKIEIKLPVEYNYYLDLKDKWNFDWNENLMLIKVTAPKIKPNTPAVDISKMSISTLEGNFLRTWDINDVKDSLFKELTSKLEQLSYEKIGLIRETARKAISEFVRDWFIQVYFKDYKLKPKLISVYFEDEIIPAGSKESIRVD